MQSGQAVAVAEILGVRDLAARDAPQIRAGPRIAASQGFAVGICHHMAGNALTEQTFARSCIAGDVPVCKDRRGKKRRRRGENGKSIHW